MTMTKTPTTAPAPDRAPGMTEEERKLFEASFKKNEDALRRLAKL